ncbi:hypothetical protein ACOQNP_19585 [Ectopseudomonas khazarica]|uniref:hypothetical protein n=1 Tax=Ectopseudomonas khazarica TaxID=2502979 RepID=UPI0005668647
MGASRLLGGILTLALLGGCASLREQLLAADYPPTYVDGFEAGCSSGRATGGPLGGFDKAPLRYQREPLYAQGWDDGFRQCEQVQHADDWRWARDQHRSDREWRHQVDQAMASALRR